MWDERYGKGPIWIGDPNIHVAEELGDLPPGRALDLACGEGRHALWLARRGWEVEAVDVSPVAIARGAEQADRDGVRVRWKVADVAEMPLPRAAYDLVLLAYVHVPDDILRDVLRRAAAALRPGGTLLSVGHDRDNLDHGVGGPPDAALLHRPWRIEQILHDAGLDVLAGGQRLRPVEEGTAIDAVVRAGRER